VRHLERSNVELKEALELESDSVLFEALEENLLLLDKYANEITQLKNKLHLEQGVFL
jgi:hypothetical protein